MENRDKSSNSVTRKSQKKNDYKGLNPLESDRSGVRMILSRAIIHMIVLEIKPYLVDAISFLPL